MEHHQVFTHPPTVETSYSCKLCRFHANSLNELDLHSTNHHNSNRSFEKFEIPISYRCITCNYVTNICEALFNHEEMHDIDTSKYVTYFKCSLCVYMAKRKYEIVQHIQHQCKGGSLEVFRCCDNVEFRIESDEESNSETIMFEVVEHKVPKKQVDVFKCGYCPFITYKRNELTRHKAIHSKSVNSNSEVVEFKCSECAYTTKRKNDMPKHMLAHCQEDSIEMFRCTECPYKTKRKSDLPKHLLCHTDPEKVRKYHCPHCAYSTKRKGDLPKHFLSHKELDTIQFFQCTECTYKTKRKNDLHKHMLTHCDRHIEGVFKCTKCDFGTDKIHKFAKHMLNHDQPKSDRAFYNASS